MSPSNNASTLQAFKIPTQSSLELQNQGLDPIATDAAPLHSREPRLYSLIRAQRPCSGSPDSPASRCSLFRNLLCPLPASP